MARKLGLGLAMLVLFGCVIGLGIIVLSQSEVFHHSPTKPGRPGEPARLNAPFTDKHAQDAQTAWATHLGRRVEEEIDLGDGVKLVLVLIPPGTFTMGSPNSEPARKDDETAHSVTITKPFYLGKYTVTQEQYEKVLDKNPSRFQPNGRE